VADFTRAFMSYSYERVQVKDLNELYTTRRRRRQPVPRRLAAARAGRRRTISKIVPSYVYNTVDNPIFPTTGKRLHAVDGRPRRARRQHELLKPRVEGVWYFRTPRLSLGAARAGRVRQAVRQHEVLPIFEKLFLGGEYSMRGFDMRTVGPRDPISGLVIGGNKSLLFNAEYLISIAGPRAPGAVLRRRPGAGQRRGALRR
jgi:outer membrane protein assembly factor BamA